MYRKASSTPAPSPLAGLLNTEELDTCMRHMVHFVMDDPELSAMLGGAAETMPRWLPGLVDHALGAPPPPWDTHAVRACLILQDEPELEARLVNYASGTLRLHHVPAATVTQLRTSLLAAIREVGHQRRQRHSA